MTSSPSLWRYIAFLAAFACLSFPRPSQAAPANDYFSDAAALNGASAQTTGTNVGATKESGEPSHVGDAGGHSVWWRWVAPGPGLVSISTAGSEFYALLAVYTGTSVAALAPVASDCNGGANTSSVVNFTAASGTTYWIAVDGRGGDTGAITLTLEATGFSFTTFAGSIGYGSRDGTGSAARFSEPDALAVDRVGNIYVADWLNSTIRRITPAGVVTTLAGSAGSPGSADGRGAAARFLYPGGIAVDSAGNAFVADTGNYTIRKVTPAGMVTTVAGLAGAWGAEDGIGSAARFKSPEALTIDGADTIYAADDTNQTIRKMTAFGVVTTLAGSAGNSGSTDGTGSAARFLFPNGVAANISGDIYVADTLNDTIRKITPTGTVTTIAGATRTSGNTDGTGTAAGFFYPWGVAVDPTGEVWVADSVNSTIRRMTPAGAVTTVAGLAGSSGSADGTGSAARFCSPTAVAADNAGNVYVADSSNNTIRRIISGGVVTTLAGQAGGWPGLFWADSAVTGIAYLDATAAVQAVDVQSPDSEAKLRFPRGIAVDNAGNVYVADTSRHAIRRLSAAGVVTTLAGTVDQYGSADGTGSTAGFHNPAQLAVDDAGNVYVADSWNHSIRRVTPQGLVTTVAGATGSPGGSTDGIGSAARFNFPEGVAVDRDRNVYVADSSNNTIRKITPGGVVTTLAGVAGSSGAADGTGSAARFAWPRGIVVDAAGMIYVADSQNHTVRKITASGVVTTLAGSADTSGDADGTGSAARFRFPHGLALDSNGNVYVADAGNHAIRQITAAGRVTTLGGHAGFFGTDDGVGSAARFYTPKAIAVDNSGNLFVADSDNHTIRQGALIGAASITTHPQSQTVTAGTNVTFRVAVQSMSAPEYQWYKNNAPIGGAIGADLTLTNVQTADAGSYAVTVTNGSRRQTSALATLAVNSPPSPGSAPDASGGGAMEAWFVAALALLGAGVWLAKPTRTARI